MASAISRVLPDIDSYTISARIAAPLPPSVRACRRLMTQSGRRRRWRCRARRPLKLTEHFRYFEHDPETPGSKMRFRTRRARVTSVAELGPAAHHVLLE